MLENISDYLSFAVLIMLPLSFIALPLYKLSRRHREKILANQEKYYREW